MEPSTRKEEALKLTARVLNKSEIEIAFHMHPDEIIHELALKAEELTKQLEVKKRFVINWRKWFRWGK